MRLSVGGMKSALLAPLPAVGLVGVETSSFTLAVTSISMALIPLLSTLDRRLSTKLEAPKKDKKVTRQAAE